MNYQHRRTVQTYINSIMIQSSFKRDQIQSACECTRKLNGHGSPCEARLISTTEREWSQELGRLIWFVSRFSYPSRVQQGLNRTLDHKEQTLRPLFSEFSYGFGISREIQLLAERYTTAYPIFPSLLNEKGWDVKFRFRGFSLFLQFKRSEYMNRTNAREWAYFNQPYYRFPVYSFQESPQHNCLVDLASKQQNVYYCAPLFHADRDFNRFYMTKRILERSVWVSTQDLPHVRGRQHHRISYISTHGIFQSERKELHIVSAEKQVNELLHNFVRQMAGPSMQISFEYLSSLWDSLKEISTNNESTPPEIEFDRTNATELVSAIRLVLRTNFGLEWFLFRDQEERRSNEQPN